MILDEVPEILELLELLEVLAPEWEARDRVILLLTKEGLE